MKKIVKRLQMKLSDRHAELLDEIVNTMGISKQEAINRAIEGLHMISKLQRKRERETLQA